MIKNLVVISDTHVGCQLGLCLPKITLDHGGTYEFSPFQKKVWDKWIEFWVEWVPVVTRGEPYGVVVNGDLMDGRHHNSTTQISQNLADQEHIAAEIYYPIAERCAITEDGQRALFITRGTAVHSGESAENEERLAEKIKPHKDSIGNNSAYEWWIRIGDGEHTALCNFNHHIGTTGRQHYESSAPMAELIEAYAEAGRWHGESPNIVVRCLSDDTEILTKNGWGKIDDVNIGNEVMTFNAFNNALQWQTVSNKVVNDNEPEMIQMIGKGMDICVTPDHNMVVRTHTGRWGSLGWKPMQMQDVLHVIKNKGKCGAQLQIPVSGLYDGAVPVNLTNEQLWLTGFFMADGSYVRNSNGARYAMRIHQADEKRNEVESCLYNAGIISGVTSCTNAKEGTSHFDSRKSRWIYTRKNCSTWYIPKEYSELYFEYLDDDKCLNACMMNMTKEQFVFLLNGFHYGDGAANSNRIFNANEKMLDQLQELMVKHGYKSNLHYNDMYTTKRGVKKRTGVLNYIPDCIAIGIGQKNNHQITSIPWNGKSWCVTVPNGTLVTRRNGCVAIVGNSHRHRFIEVKVSTAGGDGIVVVTPGWQLATPFVQKLPGGRTSTPQIGGILLRAGDEEHFTRHKIWNIERAPEVVI